MIQGTYLKIMENGDRGTTFCPAISDNFTSLDSHNHDGTNSAAIDSHSITKGEVSLLTANWVLDAAGDYKQEVTLPTGFSFDQCVTKFVIASGDHIGKEINPTVIKSASNKFYVHVMLNTFDLDVIVV
jgi:hypothetical protein